MALSSKLKVTYPACGDQWAVGRGTARDDDAGRSQRWRICPRCHCPPGGSNCDAGSTLSPTCPPVCLVRGTDTCASKKMRTPLPTYLRISRFLEMTPSISLSLPTHFNISQNMMQVNCKRLSQAGLEFRYTLLTTNLNTSQFF